MNLGWPQEPAPCLPSTNITCMALLDPTVSAGAGNPHPGAHACTARALLLELPPRPESRLLLMLVLADAPEFAVYPYVLTTLDCFLGCDGAF